jgi:hypothetical protein
MNGATDMKILTSLCLLSFSLQTAWAADNINITRWAKGTIEYRSLSTGEVSGSEDWHMTVHPDGSRTMAARNRLDQAGFQRHVTYRVAENFRPLEVTSVYWVKGEWRGTGLFSVTGNQLDAFVKTPDGLIQQSRTVPENFSMIPHPLSTNAWNSWYYDKAKGGPQTVTVYDMDAGAQAVSSMLGKVYDQTIAFIGEEEMTTPAGTFTVDHWRVEDIVDLYVTGPDALMVRFQWIPADRDYVLTSLETGS